MLCKNYKRTPNPFVMFRSDVQRTVKCTVGDASTMASIGWENADTVLKDYYKRIHETLAAEKPRIYEFKVCNPQRNCRRKLKRLSSATIKRPLEKRLNKKKPNNSCSPSPSDVLFDSQCEPNISASTEIPPSALAQQSYDKNFIDLTP